MGRVGSDFRALRYKQPPPPLDPQEWKKFERTDRLKHIAETLAVTRDVVTRAKMTAGLTRSEKVYVHYLSSTKKSKLSHEEYLDPFNLTSPVVVAPEIADYTEAFAHTWMEIEQLRAFNAACVVEGIRPRDAAGFEATKAVMTIAGGMGPTPYIKRARDDLREKTRLWTLFSDLASEAGRPFALSDYSACTRQLSRLAAVINEQAPKHISSILQELALLFPEAPIGRFMSADANLGPAYTRQKSGKVRGVFDPEREAWLKRNHPDADYRYYSYGPDGREAADEETTVTMRPGGKGVRGNLFTTAEDVSTLIVPAMHRSPASFHEPRAGAHLVATALEHWPDMPLEYLVADKLWHEGPVTEELLLGWSVGVVAIPKEGMLETVHVIDRKAHKLLITFGSETIRGDGLVTCEKHKLPCKFITLELPSRAWRRSNGLEDGEKAHKGKFRYRVFCEHGCGRLSLPAHLNYAALTALPNHDYGRPDKYALRLALQGHRNISESGFNSVQVMQGLLGKDGRRSRLQSEVNEALLWLAYLTKAGNLLAAERIHRGLASPDIAEALALLREAA
jgi:hypothetical protein